MAVEQVYTDVNLNGQTLFSGAVYLRGDATTDGSVRISSPSDNTLLFETRVSGSWVAIGTFTPL